MYKGATQVKVNKNSKAEYLEFIRWSQKFDFNLRPYFYIFAARFNKNAGVAQLVRALDS